MSGRPEPATADHVEGQQPWVAVRETHSGVGVGDVIDDIARLMASFHSTAHRDTGIDAQAVPAAILARWEHTFADVARDGHGLIDDAQLQIAQRHVRDVLAGRGRLFDDRIRQRRIVDGHGDLLCDDIFALPDGPRVLDCLYFDDTLRWVDGLDDIACLAMDLEALGRPYAARQLLLRYTSYAADPAPASLWHHYVAYRAFVRLKIACLRARQQHPGSDRKARALMDLAVRHLRAGEVRLVLVGGLPGSGKSTVAAGLADRLGAVLLSSDTVREQRRPHGTGVVKPVGFRSGRYTAQEIDGVYDDIRQRAGDLLSAGETVVVDASFIDLRHREAAAQQALRTHSRVVGVRCAAPETIREQRIRNRPAGASQATVDIARRMATVADPWPDSVGLPTTETPERTVELALEIVCGADPPIAGRDC